MQRDQMKFNPNRRAEDAVHGLVEAVKYNCNHGNKKVVILSADVKKAYPSMPRGKILKAVSAMGVTGQLYHAIAATNNNNRSVVLTSETDVTSAAYDVKDGLREGAVMSPCLYNIFMAGLTRELKAPGNKQHGNACG
jgi:hypothetical protein